MMCGTLPHSMKYLCFLLYVIIRTLNSNQAWLELMSSYFQWCHACRQHKIKTFTEKGCCCCGSEVLSHSKAYLHNSEMVAEEMREKSKHPKSDVFVTYSYFLFISLVVEASPPSLSWDCVFQMFRPAELSTSDVVTEWLGDREAAGRDHEKEKDVMDSERRSHVCTCVFFPTCVCLIIL